MRKIWSSALRYCGQNLFKFAFKFTACLTWRCDVCSQRLIAKNNPTSGFQIVYLQIYVQRRTLDDDRKVGGSRMVSASCRVVP